MIVAGAALGSVSLGSVLQDPGAIVDPTSLNPIRVQLDGVDIGRAVSPDSLTIQDTLGQPVTASLAFLAPPIVPVVGQHVQARFHSYVLFAGTVDRVGQTIIGTQGVRYACECLDWSQMLMRRPLRRNFTHVPIHTILSSILANELAGDPLTIGTIDSHASLPLVDADNARVFDVCRELAGATGQTFYVDFDRTIQMRSTTVPSAPVLITDDHFQRRGASVETDRETYRNVQIVIVTGTRPDQQQGDALSVTVERRNADQIAARQAVEGGSGEYVEIERVTHPTSNDGVALALLGIGYARLRLATSGVLRRTLKGGMLGYGFRAGQIASVDLPTLGVVGTFVIQRVTITVDAGTRLVHALELTSSSLQQRAYEAWLSVVRKGTVTIQLPGSATANLAAFTTPGAHTWTVPAGVTTVELTCIGGSGGGGGGVSHYEHGSLAGEDFCVFMANRKGGDGGNSGKAITILDVAEGQELDIVVGGAGVAGSNGRTVLVVSGTGSACNTPVAPTAGGNGVTSSVKLATVTKAQGDGGGGGSAATSGAAGANGSTGSGVGDAVSVGAGKQGGVGGNGLDTSVVPTAGQDGLVEVRW